MVRGVGKEMLDLSCNLRSSDDENIEKAWRTEEGRDSEQVWLKL